MYIVYHVSYMYHLDICVSHYISLIYHTIPYHISYITQISDLLHGKGEVGHCIDVRRYMDLVPNSHLVMMMMMMMVMMMMVMVMMMMMMTMIVIMMTMMMMTMMLFRRKTWCVWI